MMYYYYVRSDTPKSLQNRWDGYERLFKKVSDFSADEAQGQSSNNHRRCRGRRKSNRQKAGFGGEQSGAGRKE